MSQPRFFIRKQFIRGEEAFLRDKKEIKHLSRVLRLKRDDQVILFDGEGGEYSALIRQINPEEVIFHIQSTSTSSSKESPLQIILGIGVLKGTKFDWLIQKVTELGVAEIVPFYSERSIPRWEERNLIFKKDRWEKIASAAAKQCQRTKIPKIFTPCPFKEALQIPCGEILKIFVWEGEKKKTLAQLSTAPYSKVYALVGPEGGFSGEEAAQAQGAGFQPINLGPRILRSETAGIVIVSILQFLFGDLK